MQHVGDDEQNFTWFYPLYKEQIDIIMFIQLNKSHKQDDCIFNSFPVFCVYELSKNWLVYLDKMKCLLWWRWRGGGGWQFSGGLFWENSSYG